GAPLHLAVGDAVEIFQQLHATLGAFRLLSHEETGDGWSYARDQRVGAWARRNGVEWREVQPAGVVRRLTSRNGWAAAWDRRMAENQCAVPQLRAIQIGLPHAVFAAETIPSAADIGLAPDLCPERQRGGRRAALATLGSFLTERGQTYRKAMSSPVTGFDACSRLSPHFAWGTLSSKEAAQAGWARLAELRGDGAPARSGWVGSVDSFLARLHWRCHFMQKLEDEPAIEHRCFHSAYEGVREHDHDPAKLAAWERGETGLPFVDACMRALVATGYMNFRMRSMLVAFASYHLWLDWRRTGPHLARVFTDFEPGIHWSQMQMQSGTTGINTTRVYNPVKQSLDQDPDGVFIRRWVPELAGIDGAAIHTPWKLDRSAQRMAGVTLGESYPEPIVDHETAAREAKARIHAVRKGDAFQAKKREVMVKHASRKPGRDGFPRRKKAELTAQMKLDL
ncbi:MAG: FAD-binding domain-containing protein, partial [Pseudomonadota bacterium]